MRRKIIRRRKRTTRTTSRDRGRIRPTTIDAYRNDNYGVLGIVPSSSLTLLLLEEEEEGTNTTMTKTTIKTASEPVSKRTRRSGRTKVVEKDHEKKDGGSAGHAGWRFAYLQ